METDVTPNIVCTPLSAGNGRGKVEPPTKFSKKRVRGGVDRISIFRGGLLGEGMTFFEWVAVFTRKIT